jgi:hypothetical protein
MTDEKYGKEWKVMTAKLEKDRVKRTAERIMMMASSL